MLTTLDKAAEVDKAQAELDKARAVAALPRGSLPERDWQENQLDLQRKQVSCAKAKDDLESQRKSAAFDAEVKQIALDKARREIKEAEKATQDMELKAPRDGIVVIGDIPWLRRKIEVGDTLDQGFTVVSLPDLGTMRVKALLSDVDDGRVAVGMKATCTIEAFSDHPLEGIVREISPVARETSENSQRRAFDVIIELPEIDRERMLPGLSVKVEIHGREVHDATLVPRRAIDLDAKPAHVRSVDGQTFPVDVDSLRHPGLCAGPRRRCERRSPADRAAPSSRRRSAMRLAVLLALAALGALSCAHTPGQAEDWVAARRDDLKLQVDVSGTMRAVKSDVLGPPDLAGHLGLQDLLHGARGREP